MNKWAAAIIIFVILLAAAIYGLYEQHDYDFDPSTKTYRIVQKWNIPEELEEISGMVWLGNNQIACIQDEAGTIFVYDLSKSKIVKKVDFAEPGDFEAITYLNDYFWIARSDGALYKFSSDLNSNAKAEKFTTPFKSNNNIEGIAGGFNDLLLIAVKDENLEGHDEEYKSLYTYDPVAQKLIDRDEIKINFDDPVFKQLRTDKKREFLRPSDIAFEPETRNIYILDAETPQLVITDPYGKLIQIHELDPEEFFQPEGICFTPAGTIYISNEGKGGDPSILEVIFN